MWLATFSTASSTRHVGSNSSKCWVRNAIFTVIPVTSFPAATSISEAIVRISVVLPAPFTPTIPKRSPGPIFHVNSLINSLSPAEIFACWYSRTVRPRRLSANLSSSDLSRGAGSLLISSFAASTRNFGFTVCAGAPRRSHASSFLMRLFLRASIALAWRARSAFANT